MLMHAGMSVQELHFDSHLDTGDLQWAIQLSYQCI